MAQIHPTAIVDPAAKIGADVTIGPYSIVGPHVTLGDGCTLHSNVLIQGHTTIGRGNVFMHSAVIGTQPQDLKYNGEPTQLIIGDNNTFREFCTINLSATMDEPTTIGSNGLFMAYCHVAHNCQIGSNVIIANAVNLAGHIHIHDFVTLGGMTAVHQFVKIGAYAFVGGKSGVKKDVPPYTRGEGFPYVVGGLNSVGLQRKGFSREQITAIKEIYKLFYSSGMNVSQAKEAARALPHRTTEQNIFLEFVEQADRGISRYREKK
jgi:UDP-N-acetylglucosamine acyltransferase